MGVHELFRNVRRWVCPLPTAQGGLSSRWASCLEVPALQEEQVGEAPSQALVLMGDLCQPLSPPSSPST